MTSPTIAVVGGGLAGLVLARILQQHGVRPTVYELDLTPDTRRQGGLLDLHEDSGQLALREAGLHEEFRRLTQPQGETMRVMDKAATVFIDHEPEGGEGGRPEIDRTKLRSLLLNSLDEGQVEWNHKLTSVRPRDDGRHELIFTGGRTAVADLVVGADGAWSRVRPLLSTVTPHYCGITYLDLLVTDAADRIPESAALVGPGSVFALSDHKNIGGHGGRDLHLGAALRVEADWADRQGIDWSDASAARAVLLAEFADWDPRLTDLIRYCDDEIVLRQIFALPTGHSWPRVPGVTLLGDAAHVMSPYAGEGANAALQDGCELALALIKHGDDVESALEAYESAMFPRAASAAAQSAAGLELCFAADAPKGLVDFFGSMGVPVRG